MADLNFYADLISNAPAGIIQLGDENHMQNMANFSMLVNAATPPVSSNEGGDKSKEVESDLQSFSDWTGTNGNTKAMAKDLLDRGLTGADQIYYGSTDTNSRDSILHSQPDWKPALIQQILANARKNNIRTTSELLANKDKLIGNSAYRQAVDSPQFDVIHPNFWKIIGDSILPEQWAKYDKAKSLNNTVAKK